MEREIEKAKMVGSESEKNMSEWSLICSYIRSWERPGDLPRVIEIVYLFASGA
jgi:hypothetical protein